MVDPHVQRVYVAYSFLGRNGAELETPVSLPKPKHYVDKCYFNFKKSKFPSLCLFLYHTSTIHKTIALIQILLKYRRYSEFKVFL